MFEAAAAVECCRRVILLWMRMGQLKRAVAVVVEGRGLERGNYFEVGSFGLARDPVLLLLPPGSFELEVELRLGIAEPGVVPQLGIALVAGLQLGIVDPGVAAQLRIGLGVELQPGTAGVEAGPWPEAGVALQLGTAPVVEPLLGTVEPEVGLQLGIEPGVALQLGTVEPVVEPLLGTAGAEVGLLLGIEPGAGRQVGTVEPEVEIQPGIVGRPQPGVEAEPQLGNFEVEAGLQHGSSGLAGNFARQLVDAQFGLTE